VSTIKIDADIKNIDISYFKNCPSIEKKLDLLQFVTNFLKNFRNIYICPEYIGEGVRGFYLFNFATLDEYN
jgi:hypothetical protein